MNLKKALIGSLMAAAALSFSVMAQNGSAVATIKDLRKELVNSSRLQFQNLKIEFHPLEFKTCDVSYRFELADNFGSSIDSTSSLDAYSQTRDRSAVAVTGATGQRYDVPGNRTTENQRVNVKAISKMTVITTFNLKDLNPDSLRIEKSSGGFYLFFQTENGKDMIVKDSVDSNKMPPKSEEYFPIVSEKKAEKLKELFGQAITQCKTGS
jgi:hypothetical protein